MNFKSKENRRSERVKLANTRMGLQKSRSFFCSLPPKANYSLVDLSESGFKVICDTQLLQGQSFDFRLDVPLFDKPLSGKAKVIWRRRLENSQKFFVVGFEYKRLQWGTSSRIKDLVQCTRD